MILLKKKLIVITKESRRKLKYKNKSIKMKNIIKIISRREVILTAPIILILIIALISYITYTSVIGFKVKYTNAIKAVTVTGLVKSKKDIELAPEITARIIALNVKEGDFVQKNELLAVLDLGEAVAESERARGRYEEAKANLQNLLTGSRAQEIDIAKEQIKDEQESINILKKQLSTGKIQYDDSLSQTKRFYKLYKEGAISYREFEKSKFETLRADIVLNTVENRIRAAEAKLRQARYNLSLIEEGPKKEAIISAQANVSAAEGNYKKALSDIEDFYIKAPVDGYIIDIIREEGEIATPSRPVIRMANLQNISISADIEETEIRDTKLDQEVLLIFDAYPDEILKGKIYKILEDVNPSTGTFIVKITLPQTDKAIFIGMSVDVTVIQERVDKGIIVPASFVFLNDNKRYVFRQVGASAFKTYVKATIFNNNKVYIKEGLNENDVIVKPVKPAKLRHKERIKIVEYQKGL